MRSQNPKFRSAGGARRVYVFRSGERMRIFDVLMTGYNGVVGELWDGCGKPPMICKGPRAASSRDERRVFDRGLLTAGHDGYPSARPKIGNLAQPVRRLDTASGL